MSTAEVGLLDEHERVDLDSTNGPGAAALPAEQQPALAANGTDATSTAAGAAEEQDSKHPFETDPGDHAETPFEAYAHLDLLLARLAKRIGTTKAALRVYDPYYCEGRMVQHMARLGYESVYNKNEDFYEVRAAGKCPEYDILVTNPPFSGDHLERIFRFVVKSNKPWCLLVPEYVARKAFFLEWLNNQRPKGSPKPSFLAPTQLPYIFTAPNRADVREMRLPAQAQTADVINTSTASVSGRSAVNATAADAAASNIAAVQAAVSALSLGHDGAADASTPAPAPAAAAAAEVPALAADAATAPALPKAFDVAAGSFQCVWFFHLGERHHKPVFEWLQQQQQQQQQGQAAAGEGSDRDAVGQGFTVVATVKEVPQLMAASKLTPAERRWRKKLAAAAGAAGGQPQDGEQHQQQHQQQSGGRTAGGRPGSGRRQQQQQQLSGGGQGGRAGGRQQTGQQPLTRRGGGRFGGGVMPQQGAGAAASSRQGGQQRAQQPVITVPRP